MLKVLAFLTLLYFPLSNAFYADNNPYRHREFLDPSGNFILEWTVNWEKKVVVFNTTVKTKGYVGLGLSLKGKMSGADIVIGGVENGKPYFSDRHAIGNNIPVLDTSQDWTLHSAWESETHTSLSFSRPFETCDDGHDLPIHDDVIALLWAYGENDDTIGYHFQNRGVHYAYLLDPDLFPIKLSQSSQSPKVIGDMKVWTIERTTLLPAKDTTYLCTIHKPPQHSAKRHIVGFNSVLESDVERRHIHHFLFHRCQVPKGVDAASLFERFVNGAGEECYILNSPSGEIPTEYCREVMNVWAVGGKGVFFPDHVGFPLHSDEYFLLQMHFTNTEAIPGIRLRYAFEIFYTEHLREHDAAMMTIGSLTPGSPSIMIPPHSLGHRIYGQCASGCTETMFPSEGIRVFATALHTHLAGSGIRLIHIRNGKELPWITYEDNYNFNFQQNRILRNELVILPGDQIIVRCVYDTTDRNGTVTVGGFRTSSEMCNGFVWYYNKIPEFGICRGEIRSDEYRRFLGIWNTTWVDARIENLVTAPKENAGLVVSEVGNRIDWTISRREQLQKYHRELEQVSECQNLVASNEVSLNTKRPLSQLSLRRNTGWSGTNVKDISISEDNGILTSEYQHMSIYPVDIVPYERPSICTKY